MHTKTAIKSENSPVDVPSVTTLRVVGNSNLWDLQNNYALKIPESQIFVKFFIWTFVVLKYTIQTQISRAWYNGSTKASQALDEGSIPFARTTKIRPVLYRLYFCVGKIDVESNPV